MAKYSCMFTRERDEPWTYEFGAYDHEDVIAERIDWLDHYDDKGRKHRQSDVKIIRLPACPTDASIMDMVKQLNETGAIASVKA